MQHNLNAKNSGLLFFKCLFFKKQERQKEGEQWREKERERESGKTRNYINISKISHTVIPFNSIVVQIYNKAIQICKTSAMSPQSCIMHSVIRTQIISRTKVEVLKFLNAF